MGRTNQYLDDARDLQARCDALYGRITGEPDSAEGALGSLSRGLFEASQILYAAIANVAPSEPETQSADLFAAPAGASAPDGQTTESESEDSDEPEVVALAKSFSKVTDAAESGNLVIDYADLRFAAKASELIGSLSEVQLGTEKVARLLVDCIRFMDVLDHEYVAPGYEQMGATVAELKSKVATFLEANFGATFSPDPREAGADTPSALAGLTTAKHVKFPSAKAAGEVLTLMKRGLTVGDKSEPAELLVSLGKTTPAFELISRIAQAILRPMKLSREARQGRAAAFKEIRRKFLPQLINADADHESTVIRYVANLLQPLNKEECLGEMMKRLVAELSERGNKQIPVRIGTMFDDSYSTSKFERKMVSSDKPKGTIVSVLQLGFVNRDGVPVQKAILGVSGAPSL